MNQPSQDDIAKSFDRHVEDYASQINDAISFSGRDVDFFIQVKVGHLLRLIEAHLRRPEHVDVLDLGCGIGAYHPYLVNSFSSLSGIDVSEQSIEYARAKNPCVAYESYAGLRLPYADDRFDVVFAICVLHHVPPEGWALFAEETCRVLKPGGIAVIFEHNPLNPATQYIVRSCEIDDDAVLLWPRQTSRLLHTAGLNVVERKTILSIPPVNRVTQAADRMLGYLPFGAQYYTVARRPLSRGAGHRDL